MKNINLKVEKDFPHFDAQTVASQGNAILGIRDSGKSYTAVEIAERLFEAGIPFTAFDPIGKWRFLRVPGRGRGYPVVVAGGMAGDLPLTVESAPRIVRAAMENGISLVIDLYDMEISKADWRRIVADCVRVLLYENSRHGLRHIFIEEAAEFAPQRPQPDQGKVYAEIEKLARMGGNARLGYTLINQRAEEVSKAVLELCDNLFLHRQKGKNSLISLSKWLDIGDVKPTGKVIVKTLPTLPQGECWAWMAGTDKPIHIKVPAKNSFEPDRRAMRGEIIPTDRPPVDVDDFVESMRSALAGKPVAAPKTIEKPKEEKTVKETEAQALRDENADLKRRLSALEGRPQRPVTPEATAAVSFDTDAIIAELEKRIRSRPELIRLLTQKPEIEVTIERPIIEVTDKTLGGRCAGLVAEGFFDETTSASAAYTEFVRRGFGTSKPNVYKACDTLTLQGFLTKEKDGYRSVEGMKVRIIDK